MEPAASVSEVRERLADLSAAAWTGASIGVAAEIGLPALMQRPATPESLADATGVPVALVNALAEMLVAAGLAQRVDGAFVAVEALGDMAGGAGGEVFQADLRSGLLQMAAFFDDATRGRVGTGWAHTDERILQAQGVMSAGAIAPLETYLFPHLDGLVERLDSGDGAFLDVGAGVGAVTIGFCRAHPRLRAVALEPQAAPRRLAEASVREAGLADRVEIRGIRVEDMDDEEAFDLVWMPGNFLPSDVLPDALATVRRALRPGGYLLNASLGAAGDDQRAAAARLRAVLWGGDAVAPERVADMLAEAGFEDVVLMPMLPSGLVPMHARRP